jgi:hypothetical protein
MSAVFAELEAGAGVRVGADPLPRAVVREVFAMLTDDRVAAADVFALLDDPRVPAVADAEQAVRAGDGVSAAGELR